MRFQKYLLGHVKTVAVCASAIGLVFFVVADWQGSCLAQTVNEKARVDAWFELDVEKLRQVEQFDEFGPLGTHLVDQVLDNALSDVVRVTGGFRIPELDVNVPTDIVESLPFFIVIESKKTVTIDVFGLESDSIRAREELDGADVCLLRDGSVVRLEGKVAELRHPYYKDANLKDSKTAGLNELCTGKGVFEVMRFSLAVPDLDYCRSAIPKGKNGRSNRILPGTFDEVVAEVNSALVTLDPLAPGFFTFTLTVKEPQKVKYYKTLSKQWGRMGSSTLNSAATLKKNENASETIRQWTSNWSVTSNGNSVKMEMPCKDLPRLLDAIRQLAPQPERVSRQTAIDVQVDVKVVMGEGDDSLVLSGETNLPIGTIIKFELGPKLLGDVKFRRQGSLVVGPDQQFSTKVEMNGLVKSGNYEVSIRVDSRGQPAKVIERIGNGGAFLAGKFVREHSRVRSPFDFWPGETDKFVSVFAIEAILPTPTKGELQAEKLLVQNTVEGLAAAKETLVKLVQDDVLMSSDSNLAFAVSSWQKTIDELKRNAESEMLNPLAIRQMQKLYRSIRSLSEIALQSPRSSESPNQFRERLRVEFVRHVSDVEQEMSDFGKFAEELPWPEAYENRVRQKAK